jgi:hypothetical protein
MHTKQGQRLPSQVDPCDSELERLSPPRHQPLRVSSSSSAMPSLSELKFNISDRPCLIFLKLSRRIFKVPYNFHYSMCAARLESGVSRVEGLLRKCLYLPSGVGALFAADTSSLLSHRHLWISCQRAGGLVTLAS